jgi:DNA-binding NarL/FixJ family response regulator
MTRILVVDDHASFADAIATLLQADGFEDVAVATSAAEAEAAIAATAHDLAILDVELGFGDAAGLRIGAKLRRDRPDVRIIVLSQHVRADGALLRRVLDLDPEGLLSKQERGTRLLQAVRTVLAGQRYVSPETRPYLKGVRPIAAYDKMTPTERRILGELARAPDSRARLAARLGMAPSTLDSHVSSIKSKVVEELATAGDRPADGHLSTETLIGWARERGYQFR